MRGFVYLKELKYELAEKNFKKLYKIDRDKANFNNNLGKNFHIKKDYYCSIKHYLEALKINPNSYSIYADMSFAKLELGDFKNSFYDLKAYEKILEFLNKNNKDNQNQLSLGILQFKKGDFYNAISNLIEVYDVDNKNKECILYLGKAKLALKDYKNALVDFKNYIALEKNEEVEKLIKTCEDQLN